MRHVVQSKVVGKCRFWHSSIFRIGFSFDDVTSNRTVPESASVATTYGVADSGPVLFLESDFGAMTSRRIELCQNRHQSRRPMASPILGQFYF